ncbi:MULTISPECIES: ABC transporter substrate-binding protein [unclassified Isoptericola]|uniref:ABC transporter substrate-binding protein n=1 Tax=unclassified Isoptericola TaxID=2623355 RepID=UPI002713EDC8|nr:MULTISPECIES: extracellular solute-binding protein [unclassified Isoptericola]MDO8145690.1 extracellular solute-binding protein [Isoptericola sp. 178]MDO8149747.1 extracellular solute-binding protein [Isoptericola sp. b515]MDO8152068.1 extracellular solute-binding protein [Isoptericola sp. b408]
MRSRRSLAVTAALVMGLGTLTACGSGDEGGSAEEGGPVTLTVWHNSTTGPGKQYWEDATAAYTEEHPDVDFEIQSIQNEDMDGKLQTAVNSGDMPDVFMARGGQKLADIVASGNVKDLTGTLSDEAKDTMGAALSAFTVDGKNYAMPLAVLPGGMFYSQDLYDEAGVSGTPTTIDELEQVDAQLKDAGIEPIALGAKAAWPAAHWFYFFALRECSQETIESLSTSADFSDECWLRAGQDLEDFAATEPFHEGFLTTDPQEGAGSSAGLVANHEAAMELMGGWNVGVIASLTPDQQPLDDLGWFPFPEVEGGEGDPTAMMGGVDGFSCSQDSPSACEDFLNFIATKDQQEQYAEAYQTIPANQDAQEVVEDPALQPIMEAYNDAAYVSTWMDTVLGQNVGNALNTAVVELLAGQGDAAGIVSTMETAASRG